MTTTTPIASPEARTLDVVTLPVPPEHLPAAVETLLLTSERPLAARRIAQAVGLLAADGDDRVQPAAADESRAAATIHDVVSTLNEAYEASGRAYRIESIAGGFRLMTLPRFAPVLHAMQALRAPAKLSRAALETLAIVAYRQPIGRAQLEAIRGVACGEVLKTLLERRLVTVVGRAEELGRPMLYGTTKQFLDAFGLATLKDLPAEGELAPAE